MIHNFLSIFRWTAWPFFHSPESLPSELGLSARTDVFALKAFCKRRLDKLNDARLENQKRRLVEQLREEKEKRKKKRGFFHNADKENKQESSFKKQKTELVKSRRISIGWLHYTYDQSRYVAAIRLSKGGGTRRIDINASAVKEEIIARAK